MPFLSGPKNSFGTLFPYNLLRTTAHPQPGAHRARIVQRWANRIRLAKDATYKRKIKDDPRVLYFESNPDKWRRQKRESIGRLWKQEVKNTALMALWMKFRVYATDPQDRAIYEEYLERRKREREYEMRKKSSYQMWSLDDEIEYIKPEIRHISDDEKLFNEQQKPDSILNELRSEYINDLDESLTSINEWTQLNSEYLIDKFDKNITQLTVKDNLLFKYNINTNVQNNKIFKKQCENDIDFLIQVLPQLNDIKDNKNMTDDINLQLV